MLRPFSAGGSGLSWSKIGGRGSATFQPGCQGQALTAQQAVPKNPCEGLKGKADKGQWGCAVGKRVQSAGCQGSRRTFVGVGSQSGVWMGLRSWFPGEGRQRVPQDTGKGQLKH